MYVHTCVCMLGGGGCTHMLVLVYIFYRHCLALIFEILFIIKIKNYVRELCIIMFELINKQPGIQFWKLCCQYQLIKTSMTKYYHYKLLNFMVYSLHSSLRRTMSRPIRYMLNQLLIDFHFFDSLNIITWSVFFFFTVSCLHLGPVA